MSTALTTYDDRWAQDAQRAATAEPVQSGAWLSVRGGELKIGDEVLPGAQAAVIVLDSYAENTFYGTRYDPDSPQPPICYAFARDGEALMPHIVGMQKDMSYFMPQHMKDGQVLGCDGCPMNQWGSAAQGKGKACQNRRRLVVIPAGYYTPKRGSRDFDLYLFDDPQHFASTEAVNFKLPVTSVKNWAGYVHQVAATQRRPPHGVVTRLAVVPNAKTQFEVVFEPIELVPDEMAQVIFDRRDAAVQVPFQEYAAPDPERQAGGFRR